MRGSILITDSYDQSYTFIPDITGCGYDCTNDGKGYLWLTYLNFETGAPVEEEYRIDMPKEMAMSLTLKMYNEHKLDLRNFDVYFVEKVGE